MQDKKYELAIVIHSLKVGGSEKFTLSLSNQFTNEGLSILLILLEKDNPLLVKLDPRIRYKIVNRRFKYDLSISIQISNILSRYNIRKVLCVEPYALFLTKLGDLIRFKKRSFYLSLHHSNIHFNINRIKDIVYLQFISKRDKVIFICHYQKLCFQKYYYFKPSIYSIIYNGIDVDYFSPKQTLLELSELSLSWRSQLGISDMEFVIVCIGRLSHEKGNKYAIRALNYLHKYFNIRAHLVFVGEGSEFLYKNLKTLTDELDLNMYIHFEGVKFDVRPYLLYSNLFTLTSLTETFSLAALEALSMGLPCSLTDVGGARELIVNEILGHWCKVADSFSIASSWASILKRDMDRKIIREWAIGHFGEQQMINDYIQEINLKYKTYD